MALGLALRHQHRTAHKYRHNTFTRVHNDLYAAVTEHLSGMKVAKSYGAEPRHVALFDAIINHLQQQFLHFTSSSADAKMVFDVSAAMVLSTVFYVAVTALHLPRADLLLLAVLFARLLPKCVAIQQSHQRQGLPRARCTTPPTGE